jgi:DMSO/TMAO reductase YedYZ heme-binding membrane subunit
MKPIFSDLLHSYVIIMMIAFVVLSLLALTGSFDSWGRRYTRTRTGKKISPKVK